jgi:hypothetical protein
MRIAKMPHVHYDKAKKRSFIERRVPVDVQPIIGKVKVKHDFPQSVGHTAANDLSGRAMSGLSGTSNHGG